MFIRNNPLGVADTLYECAVFLDTSAFIEIEIGNPEAITCNNLISQNSIPTYTTPLIVAETYNRLLYDHGNNRAFSFLSGILLSDIHIIRHEKPEEVKAKDLIHQYWGLNLSFCDAVSFSVMLNLGIFKSFTFDITHFQALGFITYPPYY